MYCLCGSGTNRDRTGVNIVQPLINRVAVVPAENGLGHSRFEPINLFLWVYQHMQLFVMFKQILRVKEKATEIVTPNS